MKQYRQFCSVARALDVVGDRWALLVIRDLTLGPRRYTDLLDGLLGIGTNVLTTRLRELEDHGIIARRHLRPPTPVTLYELTDDGRALRPVLRELAKWGQPRLGEKHPDDAVRPGWFLFAVAGGLDAATLTPGTVYAVQVGDETFTLTVGDDGVAAGAGAPPRPAASMTADLPALFQLASGRQRPDVLVRDRAVILDGDQGAARQMLDAVGRLRWAGDQPEPAG